MIFRTRHILTAVFLSAGSLLSVACGGSDPGNPPSDGPATVRAGARLAWDQQAPSVQVLRAYTFTLYVDARPAALPLTEVRCDENVRPAGYECSGRLPGLTAGQHTLQVSATLNGVESSLSSPLTVNVPTATSAISSLAAGSGQAPRPSSLRIACFDAAGRECYDVRVVAHTAEPITMLAAAGEQLLFVEGGQRIRLVQDDQLVAEPAFTVENTSTRIVGLALDHAFESTRTAFVAMSVPSPDRQHELRITRYREVGGVFGEGATIVSGLPIPENADVPLAVDENGLLYVALPSRTSGSVLRFTRDGLVPKINRAASPIIAHGFAQPSALVVDKEARHLWLGGRDERWPNVVAGLTLDTREGSPWPRIPSTGPRLASDSRSPTGHVGLAWLSPALLILEEGAVYRASPDSDHPASATRLPLDQLGEIAGVASGSSDSLYLTIADSGGMPFRVLRLAGSSSRLH